MIGHHSFLISKFIMEDSAFLNYRALPCQIHSPIDEYLLRLTSKRTPTNQVLQLIKKSQSIWAPCPCRGNALIIDLGTDKYYPFGQQERSHLVGWNRFTKGFKGLEITPRLTGQKNGCQASKRQILCGLLLAPNLAGECIVFFPAEEHAATLQK